MTAAPATATARSSSTQQQQQQQGGGSAGNRTAPTDVYVIDSAFDCEEIEEMK
jgi:hypothetical protein